MDMKRPLVNSVIMRLFTIVKYRMQIVLGLRCTFTHLKIAQQERCRVAVHHNLHGANGGVVRARFGELVCSLGCCCLQL